MAKIEGNQQEVKVLSTNKLKVDLESVSLSSLSGADTVVSSAENAMIQGLKSDMPTLELEGVNFKGGDYVTWGLVLVGWLVSVVIARWQVRHSSKQVSHQSLESTLQQFLEYLNVLEREAIEFWMSESTPSDIVELDRFARNIKFITQKAQKINRLGGSLYLTGSFKNLRQSVTRVPDRDEVIKPINYNSSRLTMIRRSCRELRLHYKE
ncbi:hypothetical protein [uncultured Amphritea sp.]|uniref:hypothetical protein n=1 Tax=uncultured Amphritea sp. TaxID=981605 RepID=UPI0025EC909B|nr:hypothetical protein [uncultured Amphritea sp.]